MPYEKKTDDKLYINLQALIKKLRGVEDKLALFEEKENKTQDEMQKLKELTKECHVLEAKVFNGTNYFLNKSGGATKVFMHAKNLADKGNEEVKINLEKMKPFINKFLSADQIKNN